ncbi:GNAT family N-acetyltransferase [Kineococcus gynurae]|uniref:GNAT family N-acetyltransferase n=1 Tax=Kineococcus gynurae TaxID=452979 RepID=A0ABV5LRW1_9ACTN
MTGVVVVPATPLQGEVVGRLLRRFDDEFDTPGPTAAEFGRRFGVLLERDDVLVLLATGPADPQGPDGRDDPHGFAFLTFRPTPYSDGPIAQLEELWVAPDRRGAGSGSALLVRAVEELRRRGGPEMQINVDEVDVDARRFYERHGFVNVEAGRTDRMLCYVGEF